MRSSGSLASVRRLTSVARAMWELVERTDDQPGTGSATYGSAVSLRQASRTLRLAQRSYANRATISSCRGISLGQYPVHPRRVRVAYLMAHSHIGAPRLASVTFPSRSTVCPAGSG